MPLDLDGHILEHILRALPRAESRDPNAADRCLADVAKPRDVAANPRRGIRRVAHE